MKTVFSMLCAALLCVGVLFPASLSAADADLLRSQLARIDSRIASINAELARLRAQRAQIEGDAQTSDENAGKDSTADTADTDTDPDPDADWDSDEVPTDPDELEEWLQRRLAEEATGSEGRTPDWAQKLSDRERGDFPDSYEEMTGGGVYTNRGVGDGQKITDWNNDPMSSGVNTRRRDDGEYGPTEGSEDDHAHEEFAGGEWTDERPDTASGDSASSGSAAGTSSGAGSTWSAPTSETGHAHGPDGRDLGPSGNVTPTETDEPAPARTEDSGQPADETDEPEQPEAAPEDSSAAASSSTGFSGDGLEGLKRYADALNLGMYDAPAAGTHTATDTTTPDAEVSDQQAASEPSGGERTGASAAPASASTAPASAPEAAIENTNKTVRGSSHQIQPQQVGRTGDANILPGDQTVPSRPSSRGTRSSQGVQGQRPIQAAASAVRRPADVVKRSKISAVRSGLTKVESAFQDALWNGDISVEQYREAVKAITETQAFVDDVRAAMGDTEYKTVYGVRADLDERLAGIRGILEDARGMKTIAALDACAVLIDSAVMAAEEPVVFRDSAEDMGIVQERVIFRDSAEDMGLAQERVVFRDSAEDMGILSEKVRAEEQRFIDSADVLGQEVRAIEGKPIVSDGRLQPIREAVGRPVLSQTGGALIEEVEAERGIIVDALEEDRESERSFYIK